ncbi:3-oxoacyl-ACP reductase [Alsobacter soli]|uniref:3-oxoacyl-ACP reductase n=1 Tax=Alsobacter soli TaxID=2109933 RepID=A0A2T1HMW4_9HYPH|nr:SDR family oxidoreductase [Alsobacter soli]PSC02909.1 3-oxoacyl-ACP reductase [Alsobacter soli]
MSPSSNGRLAGRRIIVTGAASGIGRETAELFAREGAALALFDVGEGARELAGRIGAHAFSVDVSDEQAVESAVSQAAERMGGLDGLVNAAGIFPVRKLEETSLELWRKTLDVNLTGPFLVSRAAARHLRAAGAATIVNVGSGSALLPYPELSAYGASKGGLAMLSKVLAAELAPQVRVNVVCPGMTRTGMVTSWFPDPEALAERAKSVYALGRIGEPIEVAQAILFLTSAESSFVTGVTLAVDGGRTYH